MMEDVVGDKKFIALRIETPKLSLNAKSMTAVRKWTVKFAGDYFSRTETEQEIDTMTPTPIQFISDSEQLSSEMTAKPTEQEPASWEYKCLRPKNFDLLGV